jgi:hypothetical protein
VFTLILVLIATGLAISMMLRRNELRIACDRLALIGIAAVINKHCGGSRSIGSSGLCYLITLVFVRLDKT